MGANQDADPAVGGPVPASDGNATVPTAASRLGPLQDRGDEPARSGVVPALVITRVLWACLACTVGFLALLVAVVAAGSTPPGLDTTWSTRLFGYAFDHSAVASLAYVATAMGDGRTITVVTAAAVIWCAIRHRWMLAGWLVVVVAGSALLSTVVKQSVERARPPTHGVLASAHGFSFPSGHTQAATVTYTAIVLVVGWLLIRPGPVARRVSAVLVVLVVGAVGLSRVFLGVHWPTDVIGGWLLGSAWVTAMTYLLLRFLPPGRARSGPPDVLGDSAAGSAE